jgi:thioesterase domain-containing protein/aryl carrier-like protein
VPAGDLPTAGELREHLRGELPDYLIPAVFVELAALPLTSSGKVDRAALPAPGARPDSAAEPVAPRTPYEEMLVEIWREVLGVAQIGVHDNFFDVGGNSLLLVQVVAQVRAHDYDISLSDFFEAPTVAGVATRIRDRADVKKVEDRSTIEIRSGTTSPAMFIVHSSSGGITEFTEIAGHFADDQRVYGLQSRGMRDGTPLEDIDEMAAAYVSEIIGVQPAGPYLLAGWSMGAYVVVEMARLLQKMGREVGGIFVIGPPCTQSRDRKKAEGNRQMMRELAAQLAESIDEEAETPLQKRYEENLLTFWDQNEDGVAAVRRGDKDRMRAARVGIFNNMAAETYLTARFRRRYRGRAVLFMPQKDDPELQRRTLKQWRKALRGKPEIVMAPGTHRKIINGESAATIGAWLSAELTRWGSRRA